MITLITAASSAKAYQVKKNITTGEIILGDFEELPEVMISTGKMIRLPNPKELSYLHEMLALCLDKGIDAIIVLRASEQKLFNEALLLFEEYGINIKNVSDAL